MQKVQRQKLALEETRNRKVIVPKFLLLLERKQALLNSAFFTFLNMCCFCVYL